MLCVWKRCAAIVVAVGVGSVAAAQSSPTAFQGASIIPIDGAEIRDGYLLVHEGKIVGVGGGEAPARHDGAEVNVVDASGKVIMPGIVCTHSHIGGIGGADGSGPIQPGVRVYESVNVRSSGFKRALAGGLTSVNIMPGSGHLLSGQTVYVKLRFDVGDDQPDVKSIDDLAYQFKDGSPMGGLKMANGTNSQRDNGKFPGTRGRSAFLVRQQFIKAQEYAKKIEKAGDDESKLPARDLHLEALVDVMSGRRIVHHHTHRHDDILTVLRLAKEFGFRVVLHHVSDGHLVADEIAEAGAWVSAILVDSPGGKHEAVGLRFDTPAKLEQAGVRTVVHTDDWITDSRIFMRMAAFAIRGGMSRQGALEALTLAGAEMLDLSDRIGSLTPDKDADFIVLSGDPFSVYTVCEQTYVEGELAYDRSNEEDRLYAVGGYGAAHDVEPYFCCYDAEMKAMAGQGGLGSSRMGFKMRGVA
ncbi:MAG: amidohydrolase family protein, partial [Planctomycetota bacterium]